MQNPTRTVITKYANSPAILQLVENMDAYFSPAANIERVYDQIWNIDTAVGYGLDIWGLIVGGVPRVLTVANTPVFGFEEATTASASPFNEGVFYAGGPAEGNYRLADSAYRLLVLSKALANICDGSIPALNQVLLTLFPGRGNAYVDETGPLEIAYTFDFQPTAVEEAVILQSGVLPRPSGVSASVVINP